MMRRSALSKRCHQVEGVDAADEMPYFARHGRTRRACPPPCRRPRSRTKTWPECSLPPLRASWAGKRPFHSPRMLHHASWILRNHLPSGAAHESLDVWRADTLESLPEVKLPAETCHVPIAASWQPNSHHLVTVQHCTAPDAQHFKLLRIIDVDTGTVLHSQDLYRGTPESTVSFLDWPAWSPDGERFIVSANEREIMVRNTQGESLASIAERGRRERGVKRGPSTSAGERGRRECGVKRRPSTSAASFYSGPWGAERARLSPTAEWRPRSALGRGPRGGLVDTS